MIAANCVRGDLTLGVWSELSSAGTRLLDVRTPAEFQREHLDGAINIPLEELRGRLDELPRDRPLWIICGVGQRAYYATRALRQRGYDVGILSGGMQTYEGVAKSAARESG